MAFLNARTRELHCKLVYYGPGLGGKTANLEHIFAHVVPECRGQMISLKTDSERTLFFDFLPLAVGNLAGNSVRLHLYTVPGQVFFNATRRLILRAADGLVFVADSQADRADANAESLENLHDNAAELGLDLARVPVVMQYNKRDLPTALPLATLRARLNPARRWPEFEAVAVAGAGVFDTLKATTREVMRRLKHAGAVERRVAK